MGNLSYMSAKDRNEARRFQTRADNVGDADADADANTDNAPSRGGQSGFRQSYPQPDLSPGNHGGPSMSSRAHAAVVGSRSRQGEGPGPHHIPRRSALDTIKYGMNDHDHAPAELYSSTRSSRTVAGSGAVIPHPTVKVSNTSSTESALTVAAEAPLVDDARDTALKHNPTSNSSTTNVQGSSTPHGTSSAANEISKPGSAASQDRSSLHHSMPLVCHLSTCEHVLYKVTAGKLACNTV